VPDHGVDGDEAGAHVSAQWAQWRRSVDLDEYHTRWERMTAAGRSSHGEADLVESFRPGSVLDAGCGMGRVAIELDRRGIAATGVDLDHDLLAYARRDAPHVRWHHADLAAMRLEQEFDVVVMAGNVLPFTGHPQRAAAVRGCADHLAPSGLLIAGFTLGNAIGATSFDPVTLDDYDGWCRSAGLELVDRWSTWERSSYSGGDYAVSVHRR
jgi:SAM-dependent methyltransferase